MATTDEQKEKGLEAWRQFIASLTRVDERDAAFGGAAEFQKWFDVAISTAIPTDRAVQLSAAYRAASVLSAVGRGDMLIPVMATIYRKLYVWGVVDDHGLPFDNDHKLSEDQVNELGDDLSTVLFVALVQAVEEDLKAQVGERNGSQQRDEQDFASMLGEGPTLH